MLAHEFLDVDLDTTTERKLNVDFPTKFFNKTSRKDQKFSRINLLRDETLNEKSRKDEQKNNDDATTMRAVDIMTTRKKTTTTNPSVPLDPEHEHETTTIKRQPHDIDAPAPQNNIGHTIRWFMGNFSFNKLFLNTT